MAEITTQHGAVLKRLLSHSLFNTTCYASTQAINFAFQLWLLHWLGKPIFGAVGIAQMCVFTLIFVGELGMPSYFIRKVHHGDDWLRLWRYACRVRMAMIGLGALALLVFWHLYYGLDHRGFGYVLMAIPGMLLSARNPTPLLIGQYKNTIAGWGLPVLWCTSVALSLVALVLAGPSHSEYWLGACLSAGYAAQYMFLRRHVVWPEKCAAITKAAVRAMLAQSTTIWLPALVGSMYGLLLTFLVEASAIEILPYFLLGSHIMQGISGINMQIQRILLPILLSDHAQPAAASSLKKHVFELFSLLIVASVVGMVALVFGLGFMDSDPTLLHRASAFCLMLMEWMIGILATFLVTVLLAQHRERYIFNVTMASFAISMALQLLLAYMGAPLEAMMLVRVATVLLQIILFHRVLGLAFSRSAIVALLGMGMLTLWTNASVHALSIAAISSGVVLMLLVTSVRFYRRLTVVSA